MRDRFTGQRWPANVPSHFPISRAQAVCNRVGTFQGMGKEGEQQNTFPTRYSLWNMQVALFLWGNRWKKPRYWA